MPDNGSPAGPRIAHHRSWTSPGRRPARVELLTPHVAGGLRRPLLAPWDGSPAGGAGRRCLLPPDQRAPRFALVPPQLRIVRRRVEPPPSPSPPSPF